MDRVGAMVDSGTNVTHVNDLSSLFDSGTLLYGNTSVSSLFLPIVDDARFSNSAFSLSENSLTSSRSSPSISNMIELNPSKINAAKRNSIIADGLIHREEFQLALFRNKNKTNLFADRIFDLFDLKGNGVIEFGEFVRSLGIFHPDAALEDKMAFAFRLYDLRQTGYIEREELKEMVLALLHESDLVLSDDMVETIVDKTFSDVDTKGDGRIDQDEWKEFVSKHPSLIKNMTLPYLKFVKALHEPYSTGMSENIGQLVIYMCIFLMTEPLFMHVSSPFCRDITLEFPSFIERSEVEDSE